MDANGYQYDGYTINKIFCVLLCIWVIHPFANHMLGKYFGLVISLLWFLTLDYSAFFKNRSSEFLWIALFYLSLIPYAVTGNLDHQIVRLFGVYYFFFLGIFIFHYYASCRADHVFLGKLAFISLLAYLIGAIQTYVGLLFNPKASRILAAGSLDPSIKEALSGKGIGGYGFVYSASFIAIMVLFLMFERKSSMSTKNRIFLMICACSLILVILKASYAFAVFLVVLASFSILIIKSRVIRNISLVIVLFLLVILQGDFGSLFDKIACLFSKYTILHDKLIDLSQTLFGSSREDTSTIFRLSLYKLSIVTFLKQPIFGAQGPFGDVNDVIGMHSAWFDELAKYGLFATIPLFGVIWTYAKRIALHFRYDSVKVGLMIIFATFVLYGLINPIFSTYHISFAVFLIIPSMPYLRLAFETSQIPENSLLNNALFI